MANIKKTTDELEKPTEKLLSRVRSITSSWSPEVRGYLALAVGTFLLMFSLGYFLFLNVFIGGLGVGLLVWGIFTSNLLETLKSWFEQVRRWFS